MNEFILILLIAAANITAAMLLIRMIFTRQIRKTAAAANADLMVWFLYREKWSGKPAEILYAWRMVLYDLKNQHAPDAQIDAAHRQLKYYERELTKAKWLVSPTGKLRETITIGGES